MKQVPGGRWAVRFGAMAVLAALCASRAETQDKDQKPTFGSVSLKAGFEPDPFVKQLIAGGEIERAEDGFKHWVAKAPDFVLDYEAGKYKLTIYAVSSADTTLLIRTPGGKLIANDDGPGTALNPLISFNNPESGRYHIWVGTYKKENAKAELKITELK